MSTAPALLQIIELSRTHVAAQLDEVRAAGGSAAALRTADKAAELAQSLLAVVDASVRDGLDQGSALLVLRQTAIGLLGVSLRYNGGGSVSDDRFEAALNLIVKDLALSCLRDVGSISLTTTSPPKRPAPAGMH